MKILIFGTGGVGSIYAYILSRGGAHITAVCRSNYTAVSTHGIKISSALFGEVEAHPATVSSVSEAASLLSIDPETGEREYFDYVVVAAKSFPGTAHLIADAVTPGKTAIVLAQNGIDIEHEYAAVYSGNTLISGVVYLPTTQTAPGLVRMGPLQALHIGTYPSTAASPAKIACQRFAEVFETGGGIVSVHDDVQPQRWIKLVANAPWNPSCALTRLDDGNLLRSSHEAEAAMRGIISEVAAVAAAAGYPFGENVVEQQIARPLGRVKSGGKEPSMLTDVREGRALETEAILGNLVRVARRVGVETVRLDLLYVLTKGLSYSIQPDERWMPLGM